MISDGTYKLTLLTTFILFALFGIIIGSFMTYILIGEGQIMDGSTSKVLTTMPEYIEVTEVRDYESKEEYTTQELLLIPNIIRVSEAPTSKVPAIKSVISYREANYINRIPVTQTFDEIKAMLLPKTPYNFYSYSYSTDE